MARWYDYYARLSPLFEALRFVDEELLEEITFDIMKLTRQHNNIDVFEKIIENMNKIRPHRRWYDQSDYVAMIYYSLEGAGKDFIEVVTNYLDSVIPPQTKILGEEVSSLYKPNSI